MRKSQGLPFLIATAFWILNSCDGVCQSPFLTDGLVAHYSFSGDTRDDSPSKNDGVAKNVGVGIDRFGVPNAAAVFNGIDSVVEVVPSHSFNLLPITVSAWVLGTDGEPPDAGIVSEYFGVSGNGWGLFANGPVLRSWYYGQAGSVPADWLFLTNRTVSKWHHLVASYDATGGRLYLDGALAVSHGWTGSASPSASGASLRIGENRTQDGFHQNFKGSIDEVRIYSRALSSQEVADLYSIENTPPPPRRASGVSQMVNGFVVGVTVTDIGFGYTEPPLVLLIGGNGTGATAVANLVNGMVTSVTVTDAGIGYTTPPTVKIASPPFFPSLSVATSKVKVTQSVVLGRRYILESSKDLLEWAPVGAPFTASDESITVEVDVDVAGRFFRIRQLP